MIIGDDHFIYFIFKVFELKPICNNKFKFVQF